MNWLGSINSILGRFWSVVFSEHDFTLGVRNLHALFSNRQEQRLSRRIAGQVIDDKGRYEVNLPYLMYLEKAATVVDEHGDTYMVSAVVHPASDLDAILEGTASLDDRDEHAGYVVQSRFGIPVPHHITDHVVDYTRTAFLGVDYTWQDGAFLFYFDPGKLKLQEACVTDADGNLHIYWKAWGWCSPEVAEKDAVAAFDSSVLNDYADVVWDIHQNGANYLNSKQLLGGVTDSVICKADGAVDALWVEQNEQCMLIGDTVYHAPLSVSCNYAAGSSVRAGDVLFGSLRMTSSDDLDADVSQADIPGMRVMTDVGELVAENKTMQAVVYEGMNMLPLVTAYGEGVPGDYLDLCAANAADPACLAISVPDEVNPMMFVLKGMRQGCGILASMTVGVSDKIAEAIKCIRKNINASSMMTVYLQAEGDTVGSVPASFTATAGNAAVAVDATITVQNMFAAAEIKI